MITMALPELHIEREGAGGLRAWITLGEWCEAVRLTANVRLAAEQEPARNPVTGKAISFGEVAGEAEVYSSADDAWHRTFRWDPAGYIGITPPVDFADARSGVRRVAVALAFRMRAWVIDENGDIYE